MKKLRPYLAALFALLMLTGCVTTKPLDQDRLPQTAQKDTPEVELAVEVEAKNGEPVLKVQWKNNTGFSVTYGAAYDIQYQQEGQWVSCAVSDPIFLTVGYMLEPGQSRWEHYSPVSVFDMTKPGNYRFVTSCQVNEQKRRDLKLFAEFTLPVEPVSPSQLVLQSPPAMTVTDGDTSYQVSASGYSWSCPQDNGTVSHTIADAMHPLYCRDTMEKVPVTGTGGRLEFSQRPNKVSIRCWPDTAWERSDIPAETVAVTDMEFDWKPGGYIYEVTATWSKEGRSSYGEAHYYFYGEVQP